MEHIKLFENFSREYLKNNNNSLVAFYTNKLGDFWLEEEILKKLELFEAKVDSLFSDGWNLNRGQRYGRHNGDYFALNVKVHVWPDVDKVKSNFGIELDEESLSELWYRWLQDQAEMFEEDIRESYSWVEEISWGGNSGGWLHISPELDADRLLEYAEETITDYLDTKEYYDEETIAEVANAINSPEWKRLSELGLVEDEDAVKEIANKLTEVLKWFDTESTKLDQIEEDLRAIQRQHREFEQNAEKYFMEFLEDEIENSGRFNEEKSILIENLEELQEDPKILITYLKESGTLSFSPGKVVEINSNGVPVGSCSLLEFNQANSLDFDVDLYNFIGENISIFSEPTQYIHSMVVEKPHRGNGFSKILLKRIQEIAESEGAKYLTLITDCDNVVAQNLYRGFGFDVFISNGKKDLFYKDLPLSNILAKS